VSDESGSDATTDQSVFEGLFERLLKPEGVFADELRAAGYDVRNPRLRYPTRVLLDTLDVASRHVYPGMPREEAHRKLGQRFADRYLGTILGRVTRTLVLALGLERFLMQMPKIASLSSTGIQVKVHKQPGGELLLAWHGEALSPDFLAGALEGGAETLSVRMFHVEIVRREPGAFDLKVTGVRP